MSSPIIQVESLSKRYLVGHQSVREGGYRTLREEVGRSVRSFLRKGADLLRGRQIVQGDEVEEFWALRDVNFEVRPGEVLGIIGRNGAGKSTLLKILSRITEPTQGRVTIRGRVASLLEVGTGFHPELSGRENIYLNGAILGMKRAEIRRKFDEIVAFAGVEKFLDTPVKRYSSGMYVRLAFAVAAHLEPEILVIDEVLAVGDAEFQKKCLGKMQQVATEEGRTVLFVSHQLNAVRRLCTRVLWLQQGQVVRDGPTGEVMTAYEQSLLQRRTGAASTTGFTEWWLTGEPTDRHILLRDGPFTLAVAFVLQQAEDAATYGIAIYDSKQQLVFGHAAQLTQLAAGHHVLRHQFPGFPVQPGVFQMSVSLWSARGKLLDLADLSPPLAVSTEPLTHTHDQWMGVLNLPVPIGLEPVATK